MVLFVAWISWTAYKLVMIIAVPSKTPTFFGYSGALVFSGSMEPTLSTGDMVICKSQKDYEIDDVIAYYDEEDGIFILHRIIERREEGFITKGDFNPDCDPLPVKLENVQGKVVLAIPNMKTYRDIAIGALLTLFVEQCIKLIADIRRKKSEKGGEKADENT